MYIYLTCLDAGTLLGVLNITKMFGVCMCVLCVYVCVCVCVLVEFVQMCMRHLDFKLCYLSIYEHTDIYLPSFPLCVMNNVYNTTEGKYH